MRRRRRLRLDILKLPIILLVILPSLGWGQDTLLHISGTLQGRIPYLPDSAVAGTGNEILREIGKEILKNPPYVRIKIDANYNMFVVRKPDQAPVVRLEVTGEKASGHTVYRGFDISGVLVPSRLVLHIVHRSKADTNQSTTYPVLLEDTSSSLSPAAVVLKAFEPATDTLLVTLEALWYTTDDRDRFEQRLDLVNDYYASGLILDSLGTDLDHPVIDSAAQLPERFFDLEEATRAVDLLRSRDFTPLSLAKFDPDHVPQRLQECYRNSRSLLYNFTDLLDQTRIIPWDGDLNKVTRHAIDRLMRYVDFTARMNNLNGDIFREYLDAYYQEDAFPDESIVFGNLVQKMFPGIPADSAERYVLGQLYDAYLSTARNLVSDNQYAGAFLLLNTAKSFALRHPALAGRNGLSEMRSEAATGVYSSYLGIALACLGNQKFAMAETYLEKAQAYQSANSTLVKTDTLYEYVFYVLFERRLASCDALCASGSYQASLDCYREFRMIYSDQRADLAREQLNVRMEKALVGLFRQQGEQALQYLKKEQYDSAVLLYDLALGTLEHIQDTVPAHGLSDTLTSAILPWKYEQAWQALADAKHILVQLGRAPDTVFIAEYREAHKNHILDDISLKTVYIWNDQFDSAYYFLDQLQASLPGAGLAGDSSIQAAMEHYRHRIDGKVCGNHREEAEILVIRAHRNLEGKRYPLALGQLRDAQQVRDAYPQCAIRLPGLEDTIRKYAPVADYVTLQAQITQAYAMGNYSEVVLKKMEEGRRFNEELLSIFGLAYDSLPFLCSHKENPLLTREALKYCLSKNQPGDAFRYLEILRRQVPDPKQARDVQDSVGVALARAEYARISSEHVQVRLKAMTEGDPWFKYFESAWLREYKRLNSAKSIPH